MSTNLPTDRQEATGPLYLTMMRPGHTNGGGDGNSPDYLSEASARMFRRSQTCRDLWEGRDALFKKGRIDEHLPRHANEELEDYNNRLRTAWTSYRAYYAQAVTTVLGKMFAQPPRLKDDVPTSIQVDLEDADLMGNHWTVVAKELVQHAINEGISWLLIDYTRLDMEVVGTLNLQQEREMGLRPYWNVIAQARVLGVRYKQDRGIFTITQFRFVEWETVENGRFGEKFRQVIWVYEPDLIWKYVQGDDGNYVEEGPFPNTLGIVPVRPLNLTRAGRFEGKPAMENLAHMNIEHLQIRSDQRRALSIASYPILVTKGVDPAAGTVKIGPLRSIVLEDHQADVKWVESLGSHLAAGRLELQKLEADIRTFGLSFENPGMYATATGRNIDASDAIAPIQLWSLLLKDTLELGLMMHAKWRRLNSAGSIDVNVSYLKNTLTVEQLKLLLETMKEGALTPEGFLNRMKDFGLLADDFDVAADVREAQRRVDEELARLAEQERATAAASATEPPASTENTDED